MPYKIHLRNHAPPTPMEIAGKLIPTLIVPETPPLEEVETLDDAKKAMGKLMEQGTPPGDVYAVGYDSPLAE